MPESIPWDLDLNTSIEGIVLEQTQARIRALSLTAIAPENVVIRKLSWLDDPANLTTPCVVISPAPETTNWRDGTNESDETIFAVLITIVLANGRDVTTRGLALQLEWRQKLRRRFICKGRLSWSQLASAIDTYNTASGDLTAFCYSQIESGDKFIEAAKRMQYDASYYLLRVMMREPRET